MRPLRNRRRHGGLSVIVVMLLAVGGCSTAEIEATFVPSADLWDRWSAHDPASTETIDHSAWDRWLADAVTTDPNGVNRVAYRDDPERRRETLDGYIGAMAAVPISRFNRDEQFAYWVNLYNAVTVRTILDADPATSIRDITDGPLSPGPWDRPLVTVEGTRLTLNDIEHRILRPIWRDPRIHYAVNCAAVGCPNLQRNAFTAAALDATLDDAARAYVNHARGVRFARDGSVVVSSIYIWFQDDFGGSEAAVLRHLATYAAPDLKARLAAADGIDAYAYDWALNTHR